MPCWSLRSDRGFPAHRLPLTKSPSRASLCEGRVGRPEEEMGRLGPFGPFRPLGRREMKNCILSMFAGAALLGLVGTASAGIVGNPITVTATNASGTGTFSILLSDGT